MGTTTCMYQLWYRSFVTTLCQLEISGCRRSVSSRLSVASAQILTTMGTCHLYTTRVCKTSPFFVLSPHLKTSGGLINVKFFISLEEWRSRCSVSLFSTTADTFKATASTCTTLENCSLSFRFNFYFKKSLYWVSCTVDLHLYSHVTNLETFELPRWTVFPWQ